MASRRRASPRKKPQQRRSRAMVEVLVEATTRVLLKDGYEACTTNRVAEVAGVSIGSVYQYFPDKESLVLAVMERHQEQLQAAMVVRLSELANADLATAVHEMLGAMLEAQRLQPRLHRVLLEQVPRIGALRRLHELNGQYAPLVEAWLETHRDQLGITNPSVAAWVLIGAVEGVLARVLMEKPGWLELGLLQEHLTRLVLSYLQPNVRRSKR
ncbi:MAG: TetR/AcrR family transcriptional regulator [Archangium sp.]|nr:TetR/AcrR family transcriptional regulator [Archangium sp.]MDP3155598.1 TetR/AcrR family transcriptional regulator [Archangium sp.]MDP3570796.1 TetR/AcrR family transcriptional regulator [Archangium sp.]